MKQRFSFTGVSKVDMSFTKGDKSSNHESTKFFLIPSDNLDKSVYTSNGGLPTKDGLKPLSIALVHGLIGALHLGEREGWWKKEEHLEWIMEELQKGAANTNFELETDDF